MTSTALASHPAFPPNAAAALTLPDMQRLEVVEVGPEAVGRLRQYGVTLAEPFGTGNRIALGPAGGPGEVRVSFTRNTAGALLVLEEPARLTGTVAFEGVGQVAVFGRAYGGGRNRFTLRLRGRGSGFFCGRDCSSVGTSYWVEGDGIAIVVGDGCMFASGTGTRTSDTHGIVDLATRKVINRPRGIHIGPHVWLGQDAMVLKGAVIGGGAIVSARAVVTGSIPPCSVAAGVPARPIRRGVSWTRRSQPDEATIDELLAEPFAREACEALSGEEATPPR